MTDLPIDYRKRPWPTKHLTDETPVLNLWTIFGARSDGSVDISDGHRDIVQWVPRGVAEDIVAARNAFVDVVVKHLGETERAATPATPRAAGDRTRVSRVTGRDLPQRTGSGSVMPRDRGGSGRTVRRA